MRNTIIAKIKRFKRFTHKNFAIFASLHSEVTIGHVSSYITNQQLSKSNNAPFDKSRTRQLDSTENYDFSESEEKFDLLNVFIYTQVIKTQTLFTHTISTLNSLLYITGCYLLQGNSLFYASNYDR